MSWSSWLKTDLEKTTLNQIHANSIHVLTNHGASIVNEGKFAKSSDEFHCVKLHKFNFSSNYGRLSRIIILFPRCMYSKPARWRVLGRAWHSTPLRSKMMFSQRAVILSRHDGAILKPSSNPSYYTRKYELQLSVKAMELHHERLNYRNEFNNWLKLNAL